MGTDVDVTIGCVPDVPTTVRPKLPDHVLDKETGKHESTSRERKRSGQADNSMPSVGGFDGHQRQMVE